MQKASLMNINGSDLVDRFNDSLERVLENIGDPSTKATAPRVITMKVTIKPDESRQAAQVQVESSEKLASNSMSTGTMFISTDGKNITGEVSTARNGELMDELRKRG